MAVTTTTAASTRERAKAWARAAWITVQPSAKTQACAAGGIMLATISGSFLSRHRQRSRKFGLAIRWL